MLEPPRNSAKAPYTQLSELNRAHEAIKSACASFVGPFAVRGIMSNVELAEMEHTYTMRFARELDQFLFAKEPSKGACYHQAPSRCRSTDSRTCERCDIYCAPFLQNTYYPGGPVLIADLKTGNFEMARRESALNGTNSSNVQNGAQSWEIMLGIPGSKEKMNLEVYIPGNHTLAKVPVVEKCCPFDRALLCTIYTASVNTQYHRAVHSPPSLSPDRCCCVFLLLLRAQKRCFLFSMVRW